MWVANNKPSGNTAVKLGSVDPGSTQLLIAINFLVGLESTPKLSAINFLVDRDQLLQFSRMYRKFDKVDRDEPNC